VLGTELLVELDEVEQDVAHRAARLYMFDKKRYRELEKAGFLFEI
jgi:8-oxo-dGTP diphosphatase